MASGRWGSLHADWRLSFAGPSSASASRHASSQGRRASGGPSDCSLRIGPRSACQISSEMTSAPADRIRKAGPDKASSAPPSRDDRKVLASRSSYDPLVQAPKSLRQPSGTEPCLRGRRANPPNTGSIALRRLPEQAPQERPSSSATRRSPSNPRRPAARTQEQPSRRRTRAARVSPVVHSEDYAGREERQHP